MNSQFPFILPTYDDFWGYDNSQEESRLVEFVKEQGQEFIASVKEAFAKYIESKTRVPHASLIILSKLASSNPNVVITCLDEIENAVSEYRKTYGELPDYEKNLYELESSFTAHMVHEREQDLALLRSDFIGSNCEKRIMKAERELSQALIKKSHWKDKNFRDWTAFEFNYYGKTFDELQRTEQELDQDISQKQKALADAKNPLSKHSEIIEKSTRIYETEEGQQLLKGGIWAVHTSLHQILANVVEPVLNAYLLSLSLNPEVSILVKQFATAFITYNIFTIPIPFPMPSVAGLSRWFTYVVPENLIIALYNKFLFDKKVPQNLISDAKKFYLLFEGAGLFMLPITELNRFLGLGDLDLPKEVSNYMKKISKLSEIVVNFGDLNKISAL